MPDLNSSERAQSVEALLSSLPHSAASRSNGNMLNTIATIGSGTVLVYLFIYFDNFYFVLLIIWLESFYTE